MNRKGFAGIWEVVSMAVMAGLYIGWTFFDIKELKYWFFTILSIGLVVGAWELIAKIRKGRSISQLFWRWSCKKKLDKDGNPIILGFNEDNTPIYEYVNVTKMWIALAMCTVGWILLMVHLAWKVITGKDYNK